MKCKRCNIEFSKKDVKVYRDAKVDMVVTRFIYPCGHSQEISEKIADGEELDIDPSIIG